jgi:hypothetical protein
VRPGHPGGEAGLGHAIRVVTRNHEKGSDPFSGFDPFSLFSMSVYLEKERKKGSKKVSKKGLKKGL